jgi:hypothetical protein
MYPIQCAGGYPLPIKTGKFSVYGIIVTANSTSLATRLTLVDSDNFKEETDNQSLKTVIADLRGLANAEGVLGVMFPEPIRVRKGVTISNGTNLLAGRTFVYIK